VFAFTLKNKAGETESWHIDLKNKGEVGKGLGDKPTGEAHFVLGAMHMDGSKAADSTASLLGHHHIHLPHAHGISANTSSQQLPSLCLTMILASWSVERQMHNGCSWLES
jgi:hypothetical protein